MDPMGNIYAADFSNHRVQLFMKGELRGITLAGVGAGMISSIFGRPGEVKLNSQRSLYVSDHDPDRILKCDRY